MTHLGIRIIGYHNKDPSRISNAWIPHLTLHHFEQRATQLPSAHRENKERVLTLQSLLPLIHEAFLSCYLKPSAIANLMISLLRFSRTRRYWGAQ